MKRYLVEITIDETVVNKECETLIETVDAISKLIDGGNIIDCAKYLDMKCIDKETGEIHVIVESGKIIYFTFEAEKSFYSIE